MSTEKYNKEQIRNRMLKYAATFWGIKKAENFDPVVKLLLEALANEMYMLGEDFTAIETRLLEKTARILTPGILTSPFPAHGIVHASPVEPVYLITRESGMYYESDSLSRKLPTGSISFYPACDTLLHKADIRYMVCNDILYRIDHTLEKTMIARTERRMSPRTVWLGMVVDDSINDLRDFSFYLDFPNLTESYEYLFLLPCTEWSVKGEQVIMQRGIYEREHVEENPIRAFFQNYDVMSIIDKEVMEIYNRHFLRVRQAFPIDDSFKETLPEELYPCFKDAVREKMQDRLVWMKVQFPAHFTAEVMDELHAGTNIVPVENKLLHEQVTSLEDTFRVIPLRTESHESLLSVHSVKDSEGKSYHELLYPDGNSKTGHGTYSIRKGGCERFDSRSAQELLCYLLDLLDDETHAFGSVPSIKLQALASQMEQLMAQMKQTADNMNEFRETPYYLMIDQLSGKGQITVKYWTTNCETGNRIQAGVDLSPNSTTYLDAKTLALVSTTYGGKQAPKNRERIDIYKYGFISHGRILTQNDIASFCKKELGELLVRTEIRNGVEISPMPSEGLIRTKEVHLILREKLDEPSQEKQMKDNLRTRLSASSPDTFNYRIFIEYDKA
ncbi:flagellar protein FlgN [Bacteroides thetaiotaomicron]|uniref:flagellar protein FlgN n=1 Tax=Bacteroides thetaiotaomicron TaxID=818 RepID=UPI001F9C24C9|nr:flagellar protein FlgN [Bacteroides thetaiotaomicron]MCE8488535.1 type VI secretion system baseplate subunit TssF [Bacteroides thetaiotaomicron]